jgi:hypothetical protein
MQNNGFNKEFTDFFINNFDELMNREIFQQGFIARCYNEFNEVQKTNTNNRGSQRQLKPTVQKFVDYFKENKFLGITEKTRPIASTLSPYFKKQATFENAVKIFEEKAEGQVPDNILGFHLKEESPFEEIDELSKEINQTQTSIIQKMIDCANSEFTYDWLEKNDPNNLILGKLCSCCSHIEGQGYGIMRASIIHPSIQNLVIRNKNGEIVAKSTLYINEKEGYGVFNNVEIYDFIDNKHLDDIYKKYLSGIDAFAKKYNELHKDNPLKIISVGMNLNDIKLMFAKNHEQTFPLLEAIDYGLFDTDGSGYSGDSSEHQRTVWKLDDKKIKELELKKEQEKDNFLGK